MGGFKAHLATTICHLASSLRHKSGTLVPHLWEIAAQKDVNKLSEIKGSLFAGRLLDSAPKWGKTGKLTGGETGKQTQRLIPDQTPSTCRYLARLDVLRARSSGPHPPPPRHASAALVLRDGLLRRLAGVAGKRLQ